MYPGYTIESHDASTWYLRTERSLANVTTHKTMVDDICGFKCFEGHYMSTWYVPYFLSMAPIINQISRENNISLNVELSNISYSYIDNTNYRSNTCVHNI